MKLTEKQKAQINSSTINEYGNTAYKPIPKSLVEKISNGVVTTSPWKETGYVDCYISIYKKEWSTKAKRLKYSIDNPGQFAHPFYTTQGSGRNLQEAKRAAFIDAIDHFVEDDLFADGSVA
jgi:hypothetical protein